MHYPPIAGFVQRLDRHQLAGQNSTPQVFTSPWVMPGHYTVKLTVEGQTYRQPLKVRMDPRVNTSMAELREQFELSKAAYDLTIKGLKTSGQIRDLQKQVKQRAEKSGLFDKVEDYLTKLNDLGRSLSGVAHNLSRLMRKVQNADQAPTVVQTKEFNQLSKQMQTLLTRWDKLQKES